MWWDLCICLSNTLEPAKTTQMYLRQCLLLYIVCSSMQAFPPRSQPATAAQLSCTAIYSTVCPYLRLRFHFHSWILQLAVLCRDIARAQAHAAAPAGMFASIHSPMTRQVRRSSHTTTRPPAQSITSDPSSQLSASRASHRAIVFQGHQ